MGGVEELRVQFQLLGRALKYGGYNDIKGPDYVAPLPHIFLWDHDLGDSRYINPI